MDIFKRLRKMAGITEDYDFLIFCEGGAEAHSRYLFARYRPTTPIGTPPSNWSHYRLAAREDHRTGELILRPQRPKSSSIAVRCQCGIEARATRVNFDIMADEKVKAKVFALSLSEITTLGKEINARRVT